MLSLDEIYNRRHERVAVTAHRGASFDYPENTIPALEQAVQAGADFIEFDLRLTRDNQVVLLHDRSIDRTSDGVGMIEDLNFDTARGYNYSFFHHQERHEVGLTPQVMIPTFEEVLQQFAGRMAMNIQIYVGDGDGLKQVCDLYRKYRLFNQAYLTIANPDLALLARKWTPGVEICLTPGWIDRSTPAKLRQCKEFGCRFVQVVREYSTAETFALCDRLGLFSNVFYADEPKHFQELRQLGANGILTNQAADLVQYLKNNKKLS